MLRLLLEFENADFCKAIIKNWSGNETEQILVEVHDTLFLELKVGLDARKLQFAAFSSLKYCVFMLTVLFYWHYYYILLLNTRVRFEDNNMLTTINKQEPQILEVQTALVISSKVSDNNVIDNGFNLSLDLNQETIDTYLKWKFPNREHNKNKKWVNLLITDLNSVGVKNFNEIEKIVNDNLEYFNSFEKANPPANSANHRFSDVGVIRIILSENLQMKP